MTKDYPVLSFLAWGLAAYVMYATINKKTKDNAIKNSIESALQDCDYKHTHEGTAIGLRVATKSIFLAADGVEKTYGFDDIRNWETNLQSGGGLIGGGGGLAGGVQVLAANLRAKAENAAASGLFIYMKDIEHPKWQITFKANQKADVELSRWMEILRQHVSENTTA